MTHFSSLRQWQEEKGEASAKNKVKSRRKLKTPAPLYRWDGGKICLSKSKRAAVKRGSGEEKVIPKSDDVVPAKNYMNFGCSADKGWLARHDVWISCSFASFLLLYIKLRSFRVFSMQSLDDMWCPPEDDSQIITASRSIDASVECRGCVKRLRKLRGEGIAVTTFGIDWISTLGR